MLLSGFAAVQRADFEKLKARRQLSEPSAHSSFQYKGFYLADGEFCLWAFCQFFKVRSYCTAKSTIAMSFLYGHFAEESKPLTYTAWTAGCVLGLLYAVFSKSKIEARCF